ncbi:uncharacterized protein RCC_10734 [Ramularia collo-cygni]|uniref:Uncharacterized protein n=1 Tax=Ramularia collo-cygni TaxID=112498 RepID=A0A2D3V6I7_9PEZI|nr:uncharacterized protein RCC_10734 [Ramularia collo-cygni]CZT25006.1 uncharacterized protein RCC_10734 [Ramularia collo-cygni]
MKPRTSLVTSATALGAMQVIIGLARVVLQRQRKNGHAIQQELLIRLELQGLRKCSCTPFITATQSSPRISFATQRLVPSERVAE